MQSEFPLSDVVFKYHFDTNVASNRVDWNTTDGLKEYCDQTSETFRGAGEYRKNLSEEDKTLFSELLAISWVFDVLPHGLDINELYPILCQFERGIKITRNSIAGGC